MSKHLFNPDLIAQAIIAVGIMQKSAAAKQAFVPAGDPAMDPSAGGGAPPGGAPPGGAPPAPGGEGDPSGGAGGAAGGAAPPPPPPGQSPADIAGQVAQILMQQGIGGGGAGGAGAVEPIKPKIDVNVAIMQILKIQAMMADAMGLKIPASMMVATQDDLTQFGMQQQTANTAPGGAPGAAGGGAGGAGGGGAASSIPPISPIQGAAPGMGGGKTAQAYEPDGTAFDGTGLENLGTRAASIMAFRSASRRKAS